MKKPLISLLPLPFLTACSGEPPQNIGVVDGRLTDCPDSPNCVSSFAESEEHRIEPLSATIEEVEAALLTLDRTNIVISSDTYLYAEFTTRIMGYVDDVEFMYDPQARVTHVRSASRLGYSDLGANRNRIESIRELLNGQ